MDQVYNIDFLNNELPDKCAALIIADPPYYKTKGEFDYIWPDFKAYLKDVEKWAAECKRLLADNGTLYWYGSAKKIAYTQVILDKKFTLLNALVWNKGNYLNLHESEELRTFAPCTERILMYSNERFNLTQCIYNIRDYIRAEITKAKGKVNLKEINAALGTATTGGGVASACLSLSKSEPSMITREMYEKLQKWCNPNMDRDYDHLRQEYDQLRQQYENQRRPFYNQFKLQEILNFPNEQNKTGSKYEHETVKPETLTRALILTSSRNNDLVVAPFSGSGTECAMAVKEGRRCVGFDIEPKYVKIANRRIGIIKNQTKLLF